jgi:poly(hydroxyalkanoate) depolymerase family esterase
MPSLSDTIGRLAALRSAATSLGPTADDRRLTELSRFGSNPGALRARAFVPDTLADGAALVVVLHGCTQTAAGYDTGAGWSKLAERHGFALLFPEQRRENNPNLCFNWFSPEDCRRGSGEALSIRQMIAEMVDSHGIDPARIYVTGLSAGGAMASVMLATYPEVFAGGAIIAGLPFGCASTVPQALDRMRGHGVPGEAELASLVRRASDHRGPWPTISIWHGSGDRTVDPANAGAIIAQWRSLHAVDAGPDRLETVDGYPRRVWRNGQGREVIEEYSITGMGHGTPLASLGEDGCGKSGAYMLEASISSTRHICRFWGLIENDGDGGQDRPESRPTARALVPVQAPGEPHAAQISHRLRSPGSGATTVGKVIEDALRAAGLMR